MPRDDFTFASDNTAGICPEAWAALAAANAGRVPSYGDDTWTKRAKERFDALAASKTDLARHEIPQRPDPRTQPGPAALWEQRMRR